MELKEVDMELKMNLCYANNNDYFEHILSFPVEDDVFLRSLPSLSFETKDAVFLRSLRSLFEEYLKDDPNIDGIKILENIASEHFREGSESMKYIAECVKMYLINLTKRLTARKKEKVIELIMQERMDEFKEIVLYKRRRFVTKGFLERITQKISEKISEVEEVENNI